MAKLKVRDWSTNPDDNADVGGTGIQGSNLPSNLDNAIRETMAQIADVNDGNETVDDTWSFNDPTDSTKVFRFDGVNVPTGTTREIDAEALFDIATAQTDVLETAARRGAPRITYYTTSGAHTHTWQTNTNFFQIFAIGAGGDGGNVDGQGSGTGANASGGNSGWWGWTDVLARPALNGTISVGARGTPDTGAAANGCDGGNTTWSDGTNSFTWPGGKGGIGRTAGAQFGMSVPVANADPTGTIYGNYTPGGVGWNNGAVVMPAPGGASPLGRALPGTAIISDGSTGSDATGYGAGGGGAAVGGGVANYTGGAGRLGFMMVLEW